MKLVVGLGNPGKEYNNTRHNVGFIVLDKFLSDKKWSSKFNGLFTEVVVDGEKIIFLKPQSYMNLSGGVVRKFIDYFDINIDDILVIQDDLDLYNAKFRIKYDSSAGGHNGVKDIIKNLGTQKILRLKIGISASLGDTKDYVLSSFSKKEMDELDNNMQTYFDIIEDFVKNDVVYLMNKYNGLSK